MIIQECFQRTESALDDLLESSALLHEALTEDLASLEDVGEYDVNHPALAMDDFVSQVKFLFAYLFDYVGRRNLVLTVLHRAMRHVSLLPTTPFPMLQLG